MNQLSERTFLAIDVGNIRTKIGLFAWQELEANRENSILPDRLQSAAYSVDSEIPWDQLKSWNSSDAPISGAIIAGSNPQGIQTIQNNWVRWNDLDLEIISNRDQLGLSIDVEIPEKVGMDRLLNAVAVNRFRPDGQPAIIVDSGTATTIDLIDENGAFAGGAILPGFELSARALHRYTALLPLISMKEMIGQTPDVVGKETRSAVCSGLHWGQIGAIKEVIARMEHRLEQPALLCLTGGAAPLLENNFPNQTHITPHLGLAGLAIVGMGIT